MHASVGRRGFEPYSEVTHVPMNDFPLINDHTVLLQGRNKSKIYSTGFSIISRPIQGGGVRNNTSYSDSRIINGSCGKGNLYPQTQKNHITAPISAGRLFSAEYTGITNVSDISSSEGNTMRTQDEHKNKGSDMLFCDWPELGSLEGFETDLRNLGPEFEIGSNLFEDPICSSVCSPDVQLVPSSYYFDIPSERMTSPILKPSVSVPDTTSIEPVFLDQMNMANPINMQQPSMNKGRETPLNCEAHTCSSEEIEHFSRHSDSELFCPFDDMLVPTVSSIICSDEIVSSSTCSGPDLVAAYAPRCTKKSHDPSYATPDMILDGISENPLEMYFPPLTTYEQPEQLMRMSDNSTQMHQFTEEFAGDGVLSSADLQFCSKDRASEELCQNPRSSLILEAGPVKHLGFQKLQEGMNQLDVGTKTCIRDALYRLANTVEQKHCVNQRASVAAGSSDANRFKSSIWTETPASPMDPSCRANHVM